MLHSLVGALGGDKNARDIARVLRVPGFRNNKYPDRPLVVEIDRNDRTYTMEQMREAFGYIAPPVEARPRATRLSADTAVAAFRKALRTNPPPEGGAGLRNAWVYKSAAFAAGNLGLDEGSIYDVVEEESTTNGWDIDDIETTVHNAHKYARRLSVQSTFKVEI